MLEVVYIIIANCLYNLPELSARLGVFIFLLLLYNFSEIGNRLFDRLGHELGAIVAFQA